MSRGPVRLWVAAVALVAVALVVVALAGCGGDGGEGEERATTETGSPKPFCTAAAELARALEADAWRAGVAVETGLAATFGALDDVANSAPDQVRDDAEQLRTGLERFYSALDAIPPTGADADPSRRQEAEQGLARAGQLLMEATPSFRRVAAFTDRNCPGTALPAVTVPTSTAG